MDFDLFCFMENKLEDELTFDTENALYLNPNSTASEGGASILQEKKEAKSVTVHTESNHQIVSLQEDTPKIITVQEDETPEVVTAHEVEEPQIIIPQEEKTPEVVTTHKVEATQVITPQEKKEPEVVATHEVETPQVITIQEEKSPQVVTVQEETSEPVATYKEDTAFEHNNISTKESHKEDKTISKIWEFLNKKIPDSRNKDERDDFER